MKIIIVGVKDDKRQVLWKNFILLGIVLCLVLGFGVGSVYYLLSGGHWNHIAALYGVVTGLGMMTFGLISGLRLPLEKLTKID